MSEFDEALRSKEVEELLNKMEDEGITHDDIIESQAIDDGWELSHYRHTQTIRDKLRSQADAIEGKPVEQWPEININWDLSPENFRFAFDGESQPPKLYAKHYPEGLTLGWVNQAEFYDHLSHYNKRAPEELWELGFTHKLAYVIVYCAAGEPLTPVIAKPHSHFEDQVVLSGGNHRYAMINSLGIKEMPLLVEHQHTDEMKSILPSLNFVR